MNATDILRAACPRGANEENLNRFAADVMLAASEFALDATVQRLAMWIAQIAHESGSFRFVEELADGSAYEFRADLGNTMPGDGRTFRGHGLIQITGKTNHYACARYFNVPPNTIVEWLKSPEGASRSAGWYCAQYRPQILAAMDAGDFREVTRLINGGYNGIDDREERWQALQAFLQGVSASGFEGPIVEPIPTVTEEVIREEKPRMAVPLIPIFAALLPELLKLIPQLGQIFSSGSEVSKRNLKAAEIVTDVIVSATRQPNLQAAVEAMADDPAMRQSAQTAVEQNWFKLIEPGPGVAEARARAGDPMQVNFWKNPAFWFTVLILPVVYFATWIALTDPRFDTEIHMMVLTAIFSGLLSALAGFWVGSSWGSQTKTQIAATRLPTQPGP